MKKFLFIFAAASVIFFLNSCNRGCGKKVDRAQEFIAIENLLEEYILANENQDFDLIQKIWAPKSDIVLYGTDSDEKLIGWTNIKNAIKNQFKQIHDTYISATDQFIQMNDCATTAWFAETLNYNFIYDDQAHSYEGMRFTGVLEKIDGKWRFVQAHLSLPAHVNIKK
ncbi:MAG: nuclear transport factor 2 family protein [Chlorobi bacterium]|nr:nuclear transport factor 2 family protein [Chlorobiota bacterium]